MLGALGRALASAALAAVPAVLLSGCSKPEKGSLPAVPEVPALPALPALPGLGAAQESSLGWDLVAKRFIACPKGYISHELPVAEGLVEAKSRGGISRCGQRCDKLTTCLSFRFSPSEKRCVILHHRRAEQGVPRDYQHCEKKWKRNMHHAEAPLFERDEYVDQAGAEVQVGDELRLYAVGSSSLLWMTWLDQLHLLLMRLGYRLPVVHTVAPSRLYPKEVPKCADTKYFESLQTTRFARIGWSSWDFAYEGWEGCEDGFRIIEGHKVKCQHGAGCAFSKEPLNASSIALDASRSNITLVATWFNDDQQWSSHYKCFGGKKHGTHDVAPITIKCLLRMIRLIHSKNPNTWILVMGKYPQTYRHITYKFINIYNGRVKAAVEKEPRTFFIDFYIPNAEEGNFFQVAHSGHPNCRGSQIMATAVMTRLFQEGVLSRSLKLLGSDKANMLNKTCKALDRPGCHTSGFCWVDPADGMCKEYGPGSWNYHTVCEGSICEGTAGLVV